MNISAPVCYFFSFIFNWLVYGSPPDDSHRAFSLAVMTNNVTVALCWYKYVEHLSGRQPNRL
ncbi:hypothetical protein [Photorhabdus caribbeanensis]|uniref:hypothetical protein n=1 Tax=Photorhabdus caribbeanensis TaxID=1004165 RepID=UPI001BD3EF3C|nr:hypothetical protein [Photorhabdus caribbeanensis]